LQKKSFISKISSAEEIYEWVTDSVILQFRLVKYSTKCAAQTMSVMVL
jgi:hypothetical protein